MRGLALAYRTGSDGLRIASYEDGAAGTKIASKVPCNQLICKRRPPMRGMMTTLSRLTVVLGEREENAARNTVIVLISAFCISLFR